MPLLSVIVPCYNEEEVLQMFYNETTSVLKNIKSDYELIFVDDGSKDKTASILKNLAKEDNNVKYILLSRNFGKEGAMYAGLKLSKGDFVVLMDADLQDPPSLLPQMLEIVSNGEYDCVGTRRVTRKGEPKIRSFFARSFYRLINRLSKIEIVDGARDFRLMSRTMVDAILEMSEYNRFSKGIFSWVGFETKWLEYENIERAAGQTKWSFWKLFKYSLEGIIGFSTAPLTFVAITGFIISILGFIAIIVVIIKALVLGYGDGWASLVCIIVLSGGLQLLSIGVVGQYLAKTYLETKKRPIFIAKETNIKK